MPGKTFAAPGGVLTYEVLMAQAGTGIPTVVSSSPENDITDMVWFRTSAGVYYCSSPSYPTPGFENVRSVAVVSPGEATLKPMAVSVSDTVVVYTFNLAGALTDIAGQFHLIFKHWPR